jgi:hypothetical protein
LAAKAAGRALLRTGTLAAKAAEFRHVRIVVDSGCSTEGVEVVVRRTSRCMVRRREEQDQQHKDRANDRYRSELESGRTPRLNHGGYQPWLDGGSLAFSVLPT